MNKRHGLQNVSNLRRKLRVMEKMLDERAIPPAIRDSAIDIRDTAVRNAPFDEGDLAAAVEYKMSPDGLAAVIGPAAKSVAVAKAVRGSPFATRTMDAAKQLTRLSKKKLFQFFKGYWAEFGTKGYPERNIPAQPARPWMSPAFDTNRDKSVKRVAEAVNGVLRKAGDL